MPFHPTLPAPQPHRAFESHDGPDDGAGVDEAGCGPWAGPVVAGAVVFTQEAFGSPLMHLLGDSKKLSEKKRLAAVEALQEAAALPCPLLTFGIGSASVQEIDALNIRQARFLAMTRALAQLSVKPQVILLDGTKGLEATVPVIPIVGGDGQSVSIAAASLLAKVARDGEMDRLAESYPEYGWERNKGYGTPQHQEALRRHGTTPHHRQSFKPIAQLKSLGL